MKIRLDFVTNSSSSSFLIVGVEDEGTIKKLLDAENIKTDNHRDDDDDDYDEYHNGFVSGKVLDYYGMNNYLYYAGLKEDVSIMAETMTLKDMRRKFIETVYEHLNIEINEDKVDFVFGEYGND